MKKLKENFYLIIAALIILAAIAEIIIYNLRFDYF